MSIHTTAFINNKILVVEDDTDIQQVLCFFLQRANFTVQAVSSGQEAIEVISDYCPDLIILDLMMQPVSGWEVLHWLRIHDKTPLLPVVVLTAQTQLEQQIQGFAEGAIAYLTKPTQPSTIVEIVRKLLSLSDEERIALQRARIEEHRSTLKRLSTLAYEDFLY